jgi:hypothetical protein
MTAIVFFVFHTLCFPHEGKIMTIDQLSFAHASPNASFGPSIPMIDNSQSGTKDICVGMYSSLMGIFDFIAPIHHIYAMSIRSSSSTRFVPLCSLYLKYPWTLPSLNILNILGSLRNTQSQETHHLSWETLMGEKTQQKLP